jgi:hypothetical protein
VINKPELLLADEPTGNVDPPACCACSSNSIGSERPWSLRRTITDCLGPLLLNARENACSRRSTLIDIALAGYNAKGRLSRLDYDGKDQAIKIANEGMVPRSLGLVRLLPLSSAHAGAAIGVPCA